MYNQAHLLSMVFFVTVTIDHTDCMTEQELETAKLIINMYMGCHPCCLDLQELQTCTQKIMLSSCDTRTIRIKDSFPMKIQHAK